MSNNNISQKSGFVLVRVFIIALIIAGIAFAAFTIRDYFTSRGQIAGDQVPKRPFRATEYLSSRILSPLALKKLKLDYVYRGDVLYADDVNRMFKEFHDYEIFGTKSMVHKRYIPHLNSVNTVSGDRVLQAIHQWAVTNSNSGGSSTDPTPEYAVCFNESNTGYSVGMTNDLAEKWIGDCISTIRNPFGPGDPRNAPWKNVKILMSLGSQADSLSETTETSRLNETWGIEYPGLNYYISNSPVTYQGGIVTSPIDNRTAETAKLVDGKSSVAYGTYWESLSTTLPVSVEVKLNVDSRPLPSLVNRVRFYPKFSGVSSGKVKVEVWAVNSADESQQKLVTTVAETVTNGQMVERIYNPPISFTGTQAAFCEQNVCPVSRIKLVVREWPGKVGFYEISADRKAYPSGHRFSWGVVGLFPKWPIYILDSLKKYEKDIYGYSIHYYPGYICRGWEPQDKAAETAYGFKLNDQSFIDCTRDYIIDTKRFLSLNGLQNKPLLFTEWGDSVWMSPTASEENKKLSWRDPVRWYQFWDMLQSQGIELMTFYSPIWVRDGAAFTPAVQCKPENQTWDCPNSEKDKLGCRVAPGGLVTACDPVHPLTPSESLNPYGEGFSKLKDIDTGSTPPPPTIKNGGFELNLADWQLCGDKKTLQNKSDTKENFSYTRNTGKKNPITGTRSLTLTASQKEQVKDALAMGVCQNTIWPHVDLQLRYLIQSKDNQRNGVVIYAKDSQGSVRVGLNTRGTMSKFEYDLYTVFKLPIKKNLTKKTNLSLDFGKLYFEKYHRGIDPTYQLGVEVVADGGEVSLSVDEVKSKSYSDVAGLPTNTKAFTFVDED